MITFVECQSCGDVWKTNHAKELISLLTTENKYHCKICHAQMNKLAIFVCRDEHGCLTCRHRFVCYTTEKIEEGLTTEKNVV